MTHRGSRPFKRRTERSFSIVLHNDLPRFLVVDRRRKNERYVVIKHKREAFAPLALIKLKIKQGNYNEVHSFRRPCGRIDPFLRSTAHASAQTDRILL